MIEDKDLDTFVGWRFNANGKAHGQLLDVSNEIASLPSAWAGILKALADELERYTKEKEIENIVDFKLVFIKHLPSKEKI